MIKLLFILLSTTIGSITPNIQYVIKKDTSKSIYYTIGRKLNWNDFMVLNKTNGAISESVTQINMDINYENDLVTDIMISCEFIKGESWVQKSQKNDYILDHEQRHFDISYIYSKQLILLLNGVSDKDKINAIYDKCIKDMMLFQELYDNETNHSINTEKQKEWSSKIDRIVNNN